MANDVMNQGQEAKALVVRRNAALWVVGILFASALMIAMGLWLAGVTDGVARPWMGAGLAVAALLAIVLGVSKTTSA